MTIELRDAARTELLERLVRLAAAPRALLDIGGGASGAPGAPAGDDAALRRLFPRARIVITLEMDPAARPSEGGAFARAVDGLRRLCPGVSPRAERLVASPEQLPLDDGSVDAVLGHWLAPGPAALDAVLVELRRVLAPGGLFLWTTPGRGGSAEPLDMHDLGSALTRAGFVEPVLDVDRHRAPDGAVVEVIHAAAFAGAARARGAGEGAPAAETVVPLDQLGRRRGPGRGPGDLAP